MAFKKISIVIVVKNAAKTLENAIKSIIVQKYPNFELVIIDGLSTDGSLEIIERYKNSISYFTSAKDNGIYDAMNKSILTCKGDYIYFLGADDELYDENVLNAIFSKTYADNIVIYGDAYYLNRKKIRFGKMNRYSLSKHNFNHQTIFYPASVFKAYNYNVKYKILADYFLNINLYFKSNYQFKYINIIISRFNDLGTSGVNITDYDFERDRKTITDSIFPEDVFIFYKARRVFLYLQKLFISKKQ